MASARLHFIGGVHQLGNGGAVKFLLFLLNGQKELSLTDAKKIGVLDDRNYDAADWKRGDYMTEVPIVKVFLQETAFGAPKLQQMFYLALGSGLERKTVTIHPRNALTCGMGWRFQADAQFLKNSEVIPLLEPSGIARAALARQQTLPVETLREIVAIKRHAPPQELTVAAHGAVRMLNLD